MKTKSFTKTYAGCTVLRAPELEIPSGTVAAVLGSNGAGKSTLIRILAGVERADRGNAALPNISRGYLPQKPYAFSMSTTANLLTNSRRDRNARERAQHLLSAMNMEALGEQDARSLSGGETARMALCRLLMRDYDVLLLDEPTAAMDMESTLLAEDLIRSFRDRTGCSILWVTHSVAQARRTADSVIYLDHGGVDYAGPAGELFHPSSSSLRQFLEFSEGWETFDTGDNLPENGKK